MVVLLRMQGLGCKAMRSCVEGMRWWLTNEQSSAGTIRLGPLSKSQFTNMPSSRLPLVWECGQSHICTPGHTMQHCPRARQPHVQPAGVQRRCRFLSSRSSSLLLPLSSLRSRSRSRSSLLLPLSSRLSLSLSLSRSRSRSRCCSRSPRPRSLSAPFCALRDIS